MVRIKISLAIVLALLAPQVSAVTITGTLVAVQQGDTFTIQSIPPEEKLYKIRLSDIDTPEPKQSLGLKAKEVTEAPKAEEAAGDAAAEEEAPENPNAEETTQEAPAEAVQGAVPRVRRRAGRARAAARAGGGGGGDHGVAQQAGRGGGRGAAPAAGVLPPQGPGPRARRARAPAARLHRARVS